jgi:hypothetical protein
MPDTESELQLTSLERSILDALTYADVFDYPLTAEEIHRYLVGEVATVEQVQAALADSTRLARHIEFYSTYHTLRGRSEIVALRQQCSATARRVWQTAVHYGAWIARLPFVRMVAVTGALAVDNVREADDIDYLIVTAPGRLWISRAFVILLVRWAARLGHDICPNYFLSERALQLDDRSLFTAHELMQMIPLAGEELYQQMHALNPWAREWLPNVDGAARRVPVAPVRGYPVKALVEAILDTPLGDWLESWEMRRKIARFTAEAAQRTPTSSHEAEFSADACKGHVDGHGERIMTAYQARLRAIQVEQGSSQ